MRPTPVRVGLGQDRVGPSIGTVAWNAIERHYGSVKAAAISLGDVDPSLLRREITEGKFARFDARADDDAKAAVADALREAFPGANPKAKARRAILRARQALDELAEVI